MFCSLEGGGDSQLWKVVPECWEPCIGENTLEEVQPLSVDVCKADLQEEGVGETRA